MKRRYKVYRLFYQQLKLLRRAKYWIKKSPLTLPSFDHEKSFLTFQHNIRKEDSKLLNEAMLVLDIIDTKTSSLLSYISISFAALTFLTPTLLTQENISIFFLHKKTLIWLLFLLLMSLLIAIALCLSCLNIIGAHTIKNGTQMNLEQYEKFVIKLTLNRRTRYLLAHRISILSAVFIIAFFFLLLAKILIL